MRRSAFSCLRRRPPCRRLHSRNPTTLSLFVADGVATRRGQRKDRADHRVPQRARRALRQQPLAVSDLHHGQRLRRWPPAITSAIPATSATRSIPATPRMPAGDTVTPFLENDPVLGRHRQAFRRQLPERRDPAEDGARQGLSHRGDRQGRPDADVRPHRPRDGRAHSIVFDDATGGRRRSAFRRDEGGAGERPDCRSPRRPAATTARPATPRRRAPWRQHPAAGLFRRRRHQGGAADVQGAQQAVRAGVLVARSRRQPAQHGDSLNSIMPGINGPTSMAGNPQRRQQPRATAQGAG